MVKINIQVLVMFISVSLLFTACTKTTYETSRDASSQVSSKLQPEEGNQQRTQGNERRNFQGRPDLMGRVKSIIGNEVVLEVIEMPQREQKQTGSNQSNPNQAGQGMRSAGSRELKLTGETITFLIPVGISVTTFSQGGTKEIDIGDIYEGSILQIWYDEKDKENKTITRVMVMQGRG